MPIKFLYELDMIDSNLFGRKAATLGELLKQGLNVPHGFVLSRLEFEEFMNPILGKIDFAKIEQKGRKETAELADQIMQTSVDTSLNTELSLELRDYLRLLSREIYHYDIPTISRSSSVIEDSFSSPYAGIFESYVNSNKKQVAKNIRRVWASAFNSKILLMENGYESSTKGMGVIVQRFHFGINGVMFTSVDTEKDTSTMIEVGTRKSPTEGGEVERYFVSKKNNKQALKVAYHTELLNEKAIKELGYCGQIIETYFGSPQDIEFVVDRGEISILQSRPIVDRIKYKIPHETDSSDEITGIVASEGYAEGKAVRLTPDVTIDKISENTIIVAHSISPTQIPYIMLSKGVVIEEGGMLSHAAITSRYLKKPCIIDAKGILKRVRDGQILYLDSSSGTVRLDK